ncbi:amino acid permease [Acinetobacter pseudolwoffii]|uniref:amino acid permease n=1 Tax=Acinetobacter pseudolwoffii TaxID=2053287 RepID=UPI00246886D0|nr:amino acid permease [Acinetobacter pseudolwoffii]MDH5821155.1 amino acid permease [Acinetobacter pseudolwoffii]
MALKDISQAQESKLGKGLKQRHVTMISLGGIIGAGLFVGSSGVIATIGPAAVFSYLLAGLVVLFVMRMLGEMAIAIPGIGSFTEYIRAGLGNGAGFTSGWLYWYFWVIVVAVEVVIGAEMLQVYIDAPKWIIGIVLLLVLTLVNIMSVKSYGEFEFWFASLKVAAIIVFVAIALSYATGITAPSGSTFKNLYENSFMPHGWLSVIAGIPMVIFAICGAEIATIAAAESDEPAKSVASMTRSVIVRVLLFYVSSILMVTAVVPWETIVKGQSPFILAMNIMDIPYASQIMHAVVLVAVLSCLNSGIYVASRVIYSLSNRNEAPKSLQKVSKSGVPVKAVLISSLIGYIAVLASIFSSEVVFMFLINASGAIMLLIYLLICASQLKLRRHFERTAPERLALKMWLFPGLTYAVILSITTMLVAMAFTESFRSQIYSSLILVAVIYTIYYFNFARDKSKEALSQNLSKLPKHDS